MALPETEDRSYPRFTKGLLDQRARYRYATYGPLPMCPGSILSFTAGDARVVFSNGDFTTVFPTNMRVALVQKGLPTLYTFVTSSLYRVPPAHETEVNLANVALPATLRDLGVYAVMSDGWVVLASAIDEQMQALFEEADADTLVREALRQRIDATITDAGANSVPAKAPPEFQPFCGADPRAFAPNGSLTKRSAFTMQTDALARYEDFFGYSDHILGRRVVMVRAGGQRLPTFLVRGETLYVDPGATYDGTQITVVSDGPVVPDDIVNIEVAPIIFGAPQLTPDQIGDHALPPEKFFPRLAGGTAFAAETGALKNAINVAVGNAYNTELALSSHAAHGAVHGALTAMTGTQETAGLVTAHNADPSAHRGPGQAFADAQPTSERGSLNGYVPLDEVGQVAATYLPGPYGVKRVLTGIMDVSTTLTATAQFPGAVTDPLVLAKTVLFASASTTISSADDAASWTADLLPDGTGVIVAHGDVTTSFTSKVTIGITVVEFY